MAGFVARLAELECEFWAANAVVFLPQRAQRAQRGRKDRGKWVEVLLFASTIDLKWQ